MTQLGDGIEAIFLKGDRSLEGLPLGLQQLDGEWVPQEALFLYQWDGQSKHSMPPLGVFRPRNFPAAASCIAVCSELGIPITPRGWGTGQAGGALAARGGVVLLMGHFREVEYLDGEQGRACVQSGAPVRELDKMLASAGWTVATEGSYTSIGAAGSGVGFWGRAPSEVRVELIDGRGEFSWVSRDEVMGSEGMRGVITRVELDLLPIPERHQWTYQEQLEAIPRTSALKRIIQRESGCWLLWQGEAWRVDVSIEGSPVEAPSSLWCEAKHGSAKQWLRSAIVASTQDDLLRTAQQMATDMGLELAWEVERRQAELTLLLMAGEALVQFRQRVDLFLEEWVNVLEQHGGQLCGLGGVGSLFAPFQSPFWPESYFAWVQREKLKWDPRNVLAPDQFFPTPGRSLERRQVLKGGADA